MHCLSQQVHHLLESRRLRPEIGLAGSQLTTIAHMVAAGIGVSIVPQMMVKHQETPGCVSCRSLRQSPSGNSISFTTRYGFRAKRRQPSIARPQLYCQAMTRRQLTT